jgi:hypothetical protein
MKERLLAVLSLLLLVLTALWVTLLIYDVVRFGPVETFEEALAFVSRLDATYYLSYANVVLLTIAATMWMAGLYVYCKPLLRELPAQIGLVFVPIYGTMNLFAYLSQITIVPQLVELRQAAAYQPAADVLLRMTIQMLPGSGVAIFNTLAYAVLGIPSIVFGLALRKRGRPMSAAGILLALNGVACIIGVVGGVLRNSFLGMGTAVGGFLFFLSLFPLSWALWANKA